MLRLTSCGLILAAVAMTAACEKSAREERDEAVSAQREADQTARQAADERNRKVSDVNRKADKDIAATQHEAQDDSLKAVKDEIQKTSGAQQKANEQTAQAEQATVHDRDEVRQDVGKRLDKLDNRVQDLNKDIDKSKNQSAAADARQKLNTATADIKSLRTELGQASARTGADLDQFRDRMQKRADAIEKELDHVDDKL